MLWGHELKHFVGCRDHLKTKLKKKFRKFFKGQDLCAKKQRFLMFLWVPGEIIFNTLNKCRVPHFDFQKSTVYDGARWIVTAALGF